MKEVDLNFDIIDLNGEVLEKANRLVATLMAQKTDEPDAIKWVDWAMNLYSGNTINVDTSDFNKIKSFIQEHKMLFVIAKGQILKKLE